MIQLSFNVDAADGAPFVGRQPLVDARNVEQVHAGQAAHALAVFELAQADGALLRVVLGGVGGAREPLVHVRQRVRLDALLRRAARQLRQPALLLAHVLFEAGVTEERIVRVRLNVRIVERDQRWHVRVTATATATTNTTTSEADADATTTNPISGSSSRRSSREAVVDVERVVLVCVRMVNVMLRRRRMQIHRFGADSRHGGRHTIQRAHLKRRRRGQRRHLNGRWRLRQRQRMRWRRVSDTDVQTARNAEMGYAVVVVVVLVVRQVGRRSSVRRRIGGRRRLDAVHVHPLSETQRGTLHNDLRLNRRAHRRMMMVMMMQLMMTVQRIAGSHIGQVNGVVVRR